MKNIRLICGSCFFILLLISFSSLGAENYKEERYRSLLYPASGIINAEDTKKDSIELRKEIDSCIANFDVKKAVLNKTVMAEYGQLLSEYFNCMAVVKDDVAMCDKLAPLTEVMNYCKKNFYDAYGFIARLAKTNQVNTRVLSYCSSFGLPNKEKCQRFAEAFLNSDISYCDKSDVDSDSNNCRAILTGDMSLCKTERCSNQAAYIKALKTKDPNRCENITQPAIKSICKGHLTGEFTCKENPAFKQFVTIYCTQTQQK